MWNLLSLSFMMTVFDSKSPSHSVAARSFIRPAKLRQVVFHSLQWVSNSGQTSPIIPLPVKVWLLLKHAGVKIPSTWQHLTNSIWHFCGMKECKCSERTVLCHTGAKQTKGSELFYLSILRLVLWSLQCNSRTNFEKITSIILLMLTTSSPSP